MGEVPDWTSTETSMLLIIDTLAHRYHCLPSYVIEHATTFDLRVNEIRGLYDQRQRDQHEGRKTAATRPQLTQENMMDMIRRVREKKQ